MIRLIGAAMTAWLVLPVLAAAQCEGITVTQQAQLVVIDHAVEYNCGVFELDCEVSLAGAVADGIVVQDRTWQDVKALYE